MDGQEAFLANLRRVLQIVPTSQEDRLRHVACVFDILTSPEGSRLIFTNAYLRGTIVDKIVGWTEQLRDVRVDHPELRLQCDDIARSVDRLLTMCARSENGREPLS
jgi:hypothetical protein